MNWFHPLGGPVLLLPKAIAPKWRGQDPEQGFTRFYEAVVAGLGEDAWVGLDIGGLALADSGPIGVAELDDGLRFVISIKATSPSRAHKEGEAAEVEPTGKQIPWPGGEGLMFDAIENGATLDGGLTEPLQMSLPAGALDVYVGTVEDKGLELVVIEVRGG